MNILIGLVLGLIVLYLLKHRQLMQYRYLYDRAQGINNIFIDVSEELRSFYDIDILYNQLLQNTLGLIEGAESGSILIYNPELDVMEYKASVGYDFEKLKKLNLRKDELYLYRINSLSAPEIIRNPRSFDSKNIRKEHYDTLVQTNSLNIKCTMSAPLYVNGEFYGVINVDNKTNENAFKKNDIGLIQFICRQLEIAIKNVLLMNELHRALRFDKLTNIYNRRYFEELMEELIEERKSSCKPFYLLMIDLDDFKLINDTHGHKLGDEALKFFSKVLLEKRNKGDIVARYAGDEFIMVMDTEKEEDVLNRVEDMRSMLNGFFNEGIKLSFSAGLCRYERNYDLDRLITLADAEMYKDKRRRKKNKECLCD